MNKRIDYEPATRNLGTCHAPGQRAASSPASGFILIEVATALVLIGILLVVMAGLVISYNRAGDHFMSHHQAQLAAESYVECLRIGAPTPTDGNGIRYKIERCPGQGPWSGLTRVQVTAVVNTRHRRTASYTLTTYLPEMSP